MNKTKYLLIIGLLGVLLVSGCGKKQTEERQAKDEPVASAGLDLLLEENLEDDIRRLIESTKVKQRELTSHDKIEEALIAGEITKEEAVTKSIKASFLPEEVEDKYKGAISKSKRTSLNRDMQWAINNWDELSEETKSEIEPYIVSPDDPKYFENQDEQVSFEIIKSAKANSGMAGPIVFSTTHFDGAGKIFYWEVDKQKAERIKIAMGKAWPMFKDLLGMAPTSQTKVFYTNTGSDYGVATWKNDVCEIKVGSNHSDKYIEEVVAHELFHCFQYYLKPEIYKQRIPDIDWIAEATAVWAEDFVYPKKNQEHDYLSEYYGNLDKDRFSTVGNREYGSYMWFFFLSQYLGNDKHVNTVLQKGKSGKMRQAVMDSITNYENTYAEFALYNWNSKPWEIYQDIPKYPDDSPTGNSTKDMKLYDKINKDVPVDLSRGGMKYIYHYFDKDVGKVNRVKFDFEMPTADQKFQRQALVKIGDVWEREDWNNIAEKEYCRKDEDERVRAVILIYNNADLNSSKHAVYNVDTKGDCVVKKKGYMKITETTAGGGKTINTTLELDETVEYDLEWGNYIVTERKASCISKDTGDIDMGLLGHVSSVITGTGNVSETYAIDGNNDIRFDIDDDGKSGYILTGLNPKEEAWVTQTIVVSGGDGFSEKGGCGGFWMPRYELKEEEIMEDKIKGKRFIPIKGGSIEIEFEYDLP